MSEEYILETPDKNLLRITTYGNNNDSKCNCLILAHGFRGFKDWGFNPFIGDYFAENGFFVITFNFSHNGIDENPLEITELEKFASNTITRELEELTFLIAECRKGIFWNSLERKVGLIGHSRGGAVSLLVANRCSEISAVATWAAISKFDRYTDRQKKLWREKGYFETHNSKTKEVVRINYSFLEDIENNKESTLNIRKAVENINRPLLLAHGEQDLVVPLQEGKQLYDWCNKDISELVVIKNAGHTFNVTHPFNGSNPKMDFLLEKTLQFFNANL